MDIITFPVPGASVPSGIAFSPDSAPAAPVAVTMAVASAAVPSGIAFSPDSAPAAPVAVTMIAAMASFPEPYFFGPVGIVSPYQGAYRVTIGADIQDYQPAAFSNGRPGWSYGTGMNGKTIEWYGDHWAIHDGSTHTSWRSNSDVLNPEDARDWFDVIDTQTIVPVSFSRLVDI